MEVKVITNEFSKTTVIIECLKFDAKVKKLKDYILNYQERISGFDHRSHYLIEELAVAFS